MTLAVALVHDAHNQQTEAHWMQKAGGLVARAANRQLGKSDRKAAGVLSGSKGPLTSLAPGFAL